MEKLGINEMAQAAFHNSKIHGFHEQKELTPTDILAFLSLIHSEVSEATEDARQSPPSQLYAENIEEGTNKPIGFPAELADIIIRTGDLAHLLGINLEIAVTAKMAYNALRPHKHGKLL